MKLFLSAAIVILAAAWLQGCSSPICCTAGPTPLSFIITDSTGTNRTKDIFPSLQISYVKDGKTMLVTNERVNSIRLGSADETYGAFIRTTLFYVAEDNNVRDFSLSAGTTRLGDISMKTRWENHRIIPEELRFNGHIVQPIPSTVSKISDYFYVFKVNAQF